MRFHEVTAFLASCLLAGQAYAGPDLSAAEAGKGGMYCDQTRADFEKAGGEKPEQALERLGTRFVTSMESLTALQASLLECAGSADQQMAAEWKRKFTGLHADVKKTFGEAFDLAKVEIPPADSNSCEASMGRSYDGLVHRRAKVRAAINAARNYQNASVAWIGKVRPLSARLFQRAEQTGSECDTELAEAYELSDDGSWLANCRVSWLDTDLKKLEKSLSEQIASIEKRRASCGSLTRPVASGTGGQAQPVVVQPAGGNNTTNTSDITGVGTR